jgi:DNA-binding Lrp family transcriptional regulator
MAEIAKMLRYRPETVSSHIRSMKERGLYAGTMGLLCYQKLDIVYVPVLARAPLGNLQAIYAVCRAHPYIAYSVRTLGATDGAFLIFTPPRKAVPLLLEFLDELAARGLIQDYRIFVSDDTKRDFLKADLQVYNPNTGTWEWNWDKWQSSDTEAETAANGAQPQTLLIEPELQRLERTDIELLRIISDDAKIPTEDISKQTKLPPHLVRRRIQSLETNGFIVGYRAMISYSKFHLSSSAIFSANAQPKDVEVCKRKLLDLPFPGTFIVVQNGFICQATLPPEGLPPVHRFLAKRCSNVEVSWFDLPTSDVALLNSKAYVEEGWRMDRIFLVDEPLRVMKNQKPTS